MLILSLLIEINGNSSALPSYMSVKHASEILYLQLGLSYD